MRCCNIAVKIFSLPDVLAINRIYHNNRYPRINDGNKMLALVYNDDR